MNKVILALLGGCNRAMSILIPIMVALLLINATNSNLSELNVIILLVVAISASLFRSIKVWIE